MRKTGNREWYSIRSPEESPTDLHHQFLRTLLVYTMQNLRKIQPLQATTNTRAVNSERRWTSIGKPQRPLECASCVFVVFSLLQCPPNAPPTCTPPPYFFLRCGRRDPSPTAPLRLPTKNKNCVFLPRAFGFPKHDADATEFFKRDHRSSVPCLFFCPLPSSSFHHCLL